MTQQWPTDHEFQAFARKLADAVTLRLNRGRRISASNKNCACPLGCLPDVTCSRPGIVPGLTMHQTWQFYTGFDLGREETPLQRLGAAYRARFP
jgi:hypothetical protein